MPVPAGPAGRWAQARGPAVVASPQQDYALLDFGNGRRLERFGPLVLDRPAPQAARPPALAHWSADWVYDGPRTAAGRWTPGVAGQIAGQVACQVAGQVSGQVSGQGCGPGSGGGQPAVPEPFDIQVDGERLCISLGSGGQVGIYPEHISCWRWLRGLLARRPAGAELLNLFAASGGASVAATRRRAAVTHLDALNSALNLARRNLARVAPEPAGPDTEPAGSPRILREDAVRFARRCRRQGRRFDLILLDPPSFGRGPKGQTWVLERDLPGLLEDLAALLPAQPDSGPTGLWLSTHSRGWDAARLAAVAGPLLERTRPGARMQAFELGVAASDGRVLASGHALTVVWQ